MNLRHLSIALFISLGANLFLGGLLLGSAFGEPDGPPPRPHAHHPLGPRPLGPQRHDEANGPRGPLAGRTGAQANPGGKGAEPDKRERRSARGGDESDDVLLLRKMMKIMGGPDDPRVRSLREEARKDVRDLRKNVREAREEVLTALAQEPFDAARLEQAMAKVRAQRGAAQERAQAGVVKLASLMTPEERVHLRQLKKQLDEGTGERDNGHERDRGEDDLHPPGSKGTKAPRP